MLALFVKVKSLPAWPWRGQLCCSSARLDQQSSWHPKPHGILHPCCFINPCFYSFHPGRGTLKPVSSWVCSQLSPQPGQAGLLAGWRGVRASWLPAVPMGYPGKPCGLQAGPKAKCEAAPGVAGPPWGWQLPSRLCG